MIGYLVHDMNHIMSRIVEIRYTDIEEEKKLCLELLAWANERDDPYGTAYAYTYLGDYYIAVYDAVHAGVNLLKAEQLLQDTELWDGLRMRLYCLLGIYYEMRTDAQNAVAYYLDAITAAEAIGDAEGECTVLNNLAYVFQRYRCYEEAYEYYKKAYDIQKPLNENPVRSILLVNLAEISLELNKFEEAKHYIIECASSERDETQRMLMSDWNWCVYFSVTGDRQKALVYADRNLDHQDIINEDKLTAFEIYHSLFKNMVNMGEKDYACRFLHAMERVGGEELDRSRLLEEAQIRYTLLFEPVVNHETAYRRFYKKNQAFRSMVDEAIANAMKSKIRLDYMMTQTERMHAEQETLQRQVDLDELTGLYNRGYLEELIHKLETDQSKGYFGFIILDVDYFKEYNDYYGHIQGDEVLRQIASCLKESAGKGIDPCRYGGDEFVCVCDGVSEEEVLSYVIRVRDSLHTRAISHIMSSCEKEVTLSVGYVIEDTARTAAQELLKLADQALYQSKRYGRNTYTRKRADEI